MQTLILKIEYDGTNYGGWQIQPNAPTVQEEIQKAYFSLTGEQINLVGAGRTDAGVHARGMVAHAVLENELKIPQKKIVKAINGNLPLDIRITDAVLTDKKFNARFDAISREYSYSIHLKETPFLNRYSTYIRYKLDIEKLFASAKVFLGKHNFTTFSKLNSDTKNYICTVEKCEWERISDNQYILHIKADRFVYGMVRSLVGAMLDVARGKRSIKDIRESLEQENRELISPIAPPQGLVLEKIYYPEDMSLDD
ncbi:MAG: tRNA pseudouridine(38-40) synthase TruA [bacterium]